MFPSSSVFYCPLQLPHAVISISLLEVLSLGLRQLVHEADHSPPTNTEFKNTWNDASIPSCTSWLSALSIGTQHFMHCAKTDAVTCRHVMVEAWVCFQTCPCGICGGQSGT